MADASTVRRAATLPTATGRNKSSIRYDDARDTVVVSNGTNWCPTTYFTAVYRQQPNGELADECFYIANRPVKVVSISEVHSTAGTNGSAVNLQVTNDSVTDAPGAGADLLSNNTNAGFNMKGTANTVQVGTFKTTNNRIATAVVGSSGGTGYSVNDVLTVAGGTGTAATVTVTAVSSGAVTAVSITTKGAYTVNPTLTSNSVTGGGGSGAKITLTVEPVIKLATGDRLSVDFAGTLTTLAGVVVTATLQYI